MFAPPTGWTGQQQQQQEFAQTANMPPTFGVPPAAGVAGTMLTVATRTVNGTAMTATMDTTGVTHADDDELIDAVERILSAEENRRMAAESISACRSPTAVNEHKVGPLTENELSILSLLCTKVTSNFRARATAPPGTHLPQGFCAVDAETLTTLTELLEKHVNLAVNVDLVGEALKVIGEQKAPYEKIDQWLLNGAAGYDRVLSLRLGLEAASILLFIVTSPGVELRVVSEDAIEAAFTLLRHNLTKNIIPALNNTGHMLATRAMEEEKGISSPRKRRRRSSTGTTGGGTALVRDLKKVYKHIIGANMLHLQLMERIELIVHKVFLDDQLIVTLTSGALEALEVEAAVAGQSRGSNPAYLLQTATISIVTAVFRKFPMHRTSIIEDLFPLMLRLPAHKRTMRIYHVRYTSCPSPRSTNALSTSLFSTMLSNGEQPHRVQMFTALLLSLIQSCVVRPTYISDQPNDEEGRPTQLISGLRDSQAIADMFAVQMVQRCSRKGEDGGASEFRPVLSNLIEDLLLVLMIPEYPAAQMVLQSFVHVMSRDVIQASQLTSSSADKEFESTYINTCFDAIGRIASAYAVLAKAKRDKEFITTITVAPQDCNRQHVRCYCKQNDKTDTLMVDCDDCHIWYHAGCIGLSRETVPEKWLCDTCRLQTIVVDEKAAQGKSSTSGIVSGTFAMNRVLERHLRRIGFEVAAQFHIARWVEDLEKEAKSPKSRDGEEEAGRKNDIRHVAAQVLERWDRRADRRPSHFLFTEEGGMRALLSLTTSNSGFLVSFNTQMGLLLKLMSDKAHASIRKLSLKALEKVVDADPKLMLLQKVMGAVSRRFSDDAISVREAVISLVGSYVVSSPALANAFHPYLIPRLMDEGVSVRKRTVKILQDILYTNPQYKGRSEACDKLLQRAGDKKEDDGVREVIHCLFMKLWLEDGDIFIGTHHDAADAAGHAASGLVASPSGSAADASADSAAAQIEGVSGVVTPTPPEARTTRSKHRQVGKLRSELAAEQMVAAVKVSGTGEHLGMFMKELLSDIMDSDKGKKSGERKKRKKVAEKQCFSLVDALFEVLLSTEEHRNRYGNNFGTELVAIIATIGVFSEVSTSAVLKHMETILPYLKADNGIPFADESALASGVSDILFRLVPILDQREIQRLSASSVAMDLVKITYKFGSAALASAVRALSTLAHHRHAGEDSVFGMQLMKLGRTFYTYLFQKVDTEDFDALDTKEKNHIKRLLMGLGSLCRHHEVFIEASEWDEEVGTDDMELLEPSELTWSNVAVGCYRIFERFLQKSDIAIKCSALRALSGNFVAHPRLMLAMEQSGLIDDVMSPDAPLELQLESLRCWRDILLSEERRFESGDAKAKMESKEEITTTRRISGDQDGDSTLVGGVLTKHTPRLFEMTQAKDTLTRYTSVELLGQLLRMGLVNPNDAVPYLFALQGDVDEFAIRALALRLLILEGEKRPDMLRMRIRAGVKQACLFQREVYPTKEVSALVKVKKGHSIELECVFDSVFKECVAGSRKQREGLYRNLLGLFERVESTAEGAKQKKSRSRRRSEIVEEETFRDLPLLSFSAQVLAYLPYSIPTDPLLIVYCITQLVALQGPQLQDRLAAFLRPYGLSSDDELDLANAGEDALEAAAKCKTPSRTDEASPVNGKDFDWNAFFELCQEASAMSLLLRLKRFLRKRYNLSEARCLEFNPDSKERDSKKYIISRCLDMAPFDSSVLTVPGDFKKLTASEKDSIIVHYAKFRKLVRVESANEYSDEQLEEDGNQHNNENGNQESAKRRRSSTGRQNSGAAEVAEAVAAAAAVALTEENGDGDQEPEEPKTQKRRKSNGAAAAAGGDDGEDVDGGQKPAAKRRRSSRGSSRRNSLEPEQIRSDGFLPM